MKVKALFLYNIDPHHLLEINEKLKINEYLKSKSVFFSGILDGLEKIILMHLYTISQIFFWIFYY